MRNDEDCFASLKIVVVGLGLMGGSLALGLRNEVPEILAVDPNPDCRQYALLNKVVARVSADPTEILHDGDVIVLSAPVDAILRFIPLLPELHPGSPIVIDLGSTKVKISQALSKLPPRFEAIGGHPMCGKAESGLEYADPSIFQGSAFAFTLLDRTTPRARHFAEWLAGMLGAFPVWLGPDTHDRWVAATSHLPYLISSALTLATPSEASHLVGPGFLSSSRLAGSPSSVMLPILETNREYVLESITHFRQQLDAMEAELSGGHLDGMRSILDRAKKHRETLTAPKK